MGPEVYDGRGPDLQVAEKNAIKAASEKAALELVSQLANKIYIRKDKKNE